MQFTVMTRGAWEQEQGVGQPLFRWQVKEAVGTWWGSQRSCREEAGVMLQDDILHGFSVGGFKALYLHQDLSNYAMGRAVGTFEVAGKQPGVGGVQDGLKGAGGAVAHQWVASNQDPENKQDCSFICNFFFLYPSWSIVRLSS